MARSSKIRKSPPKGSSALQIRLRVLTSERNAFGPGKAELLQLVTDTGSLRAAAEKMSMSYMKAWRLVKDMNLSFREPLIVMERGGSLHGGSVVTATGRRVLADYLAMMSAVERSAQPAWRKLARHLKAE